MNPLARQADPIAAVATAPGRGAVGIVRATGRDLRGLVHALCGRDLEARHATLLDFRDAQGSVIDTGLALHFPAPHSYTGEDVLELQVHGGPVVLQLLLLRLLELGRDRGLRPAEPGEFTQRAFLNGKLDLAQAEAVADVIAAGSEAALRAAQRALSGAFSARVRELQTLLTGARVQIEAALDFPEEELELLADPALAAALTGLVAALDAVLAEARRGVRLARGLEVVLVGAPNVGKSSLLNALAGTERAIVTAVPGTTRDVLCVELALDGVRLQVADTAGLRATHDPVESEGVRRALAALAQADLALLVTGAEDWQRDLALLRQQAGASPELLVVVNKIDLDQLPAARSAEPGMPPRIALSAQTGAGLDLLRAELRARAGGVGADSAFSARERHLDALQRAAAEIAAARAEVARAGHGGMAELAAEALRRAQGALDELTGQHSSDDLLGAIFSSFCIGK